MSERSVPPPPDHEDKPVAEDSKASVGERLTGKSDPQDPDGLLTLDDFDKVKGTQDRLGGDSALGSVSNAGAAPTPNLTEGVVGGDAPSIGALNSGGDSMGDDADLPTGDGTTGETPWAKQQGLTTDT
ncbi:hypothetical protein [Naasia sp. SYSU D00948]|uniref:hypothetical protein n=1 Tax=Naasia sp. SYSU D00948 TaxID=2817379 RepID=UPI001B310AA4|nr:hypothetical protein [Naasia sp. SYSU D00948]